MCLPDVSLNIEGFLEESDGGYEWETWYIPWYIDFENMGEIVHVLKGEKG